METVSFKNSITGGEEKQDALEMKKTCSRSMGIALVFLLILIAFCSCNSKSNEPPPSMEIPEITSTPVSTPMPPVKAADKIKVKIDFIDTITFEPSAAGTAGAGGDTGDTGAIFKSRPQDFCLTEDGIFIFPDPKDQSVKLFTLEDKHLKLLKKFGKNFGKEGFAKPVTCHYYQYNGVRILGIIDYWANRVLLFCREGDNDFKYDKTVNCPHSGYDMGFASGGALLVISGSTFDPERNPYDLYAVNFKNYQLDYLVKSYQKYYLESEEAYQEEFFKKQTLPAIGQRAFLDIDEDHVFFAWEGALRFIRLNLETNELYVFGEDKRRDKDSEKQLGAFYKNQNFEEMLKLRQKRPYVKDIFVLAHHVFLVYQPENTFSLRLQVYTEEGEYMGDYEIPDNPGTPIYLDKAKNELYAFTKEKSRTEENFVLLKYKIETETEKMSQSD